MRRPDFGRSLGKTFWWRYNLTAASSFLRGIGYELRWYGVTIPGTEIGVGVFVRRRLPAPETEVGR